jgi:hypothetical protein
LGAVQDETIRQALKIIFDRLHATQEAVEDTEVQVVAVGGVIDTHSSRTDNPHQVTAAQVGAPTVAAFENHHVRHEAGGDDEIDVTNLQGVLAEPQTVAVATLGALDGDGSAGDPLTVLVDDTTITINPSTNQLEVIGGGSVNELNDLDDVDIVTPMEGETLLYDQSAGVWYNAPGGSGSGLTQPQVLARAGLRA